MGLPAQRVYLQTRAINAAVKDPSPQVLLRESLHASAFPADRMAVDIVRSQPRRRPIAGIAACDREMVDDVLEAFIQCGLTQYRVEPNPCGLMRRATQADPKTGGEAVIRVSLGEITGIAVLLAKDLPITWRAFNIVRGDESTGILSAVRSLQTTAPHCGLDGKLDAVVIHGRSELQTLTDFEWLRSEIDVRTSWVDSPALQPEHTAYGLALGAFENDDVLHFDLVRKRKPIPTLMERFPWRTATYQLLIVLSMTFFLIGHYRRVHDDYEQVRESNRLHPWLKQKQQAELNKQKKDTEVELSSIKKFLDTRVVWTRQLRQVVKQLPNELSLAVVEGSAELPSSSKKKIVSKKPAKSLVVRGQAAFSDGDSTPPEIGRFVERMRAAEDVRDEFPVVELTGLIRTKSVDLDKPVTSFTVEFKPKSRSPGR